MTCDLAFVIAVPELAERLEVFWGLNIRMFMSISHR